MIRFTASISAIAIAAIALVGFHLSAAQTSTNATDNYPWPDGQGKAIVKKSCLSCHAANVIVKKPGRTQDEWADVLSKMVGRGAVISDEDADTLIQYLATNFGPDSKNPPPASSETAPEKAAPPADTDNATHASSDAPAAVNVNKASAEELASALGLTQTEAELIVRYREQHGDFKSWQDVASVSGVPSDKIKENQKHLTF